MIFSTELARSTRETIQHPYQLRQSLEAARKEKKEAEFINNLMGQLDRSVAVYGMITLRTDGRSILMAQKLEQQRGAGDKWDLHLIISKKWEVDLFTAIKRVALRSHATYQFSQRIDPEPLEMQKPADSIDRFLSAC